MSRRRIRASALSCAVAYALVCATAVLLGQSGAPANPTPPPGATTSQSTAPPTWMPDIKFSSGREVVPYYEGWIRNADGSFDFIFGYFSRNTEQELAIPAGPDNSVMPGGPDRGQPTYFLPRRQPRVFRVRVPKDWGDKSLTWSITANGRTEKVVGKLVPAYEKDELFMATDNRTTIQFGEEDTNRPPVLTVANALTASAAAPLVLTANVVDDGLPKPRPPVAAKPAAPPPQGDAARFQSQRNNSAPRTQLGPRVSWLEYRGPAKVTFEPAAMAVAGGKAETTARFAAPGVYTLIVTATDGKLSTRQSVVVTVQ
jgi:hypothetical protein